MNNSSFSTILKEISQLSSTMQCSSEPQKNRLIFDESGKARRVSKYDQKVPKQLTHTLGIIEKKLNVLLDKMKDEKEFKGITEGEISTLSDKVEYIKIWSNKAVENYQNKLINKIIDWLPFPFLKKNQKIANIIDHQSQNVEQQIENLKNAFAISKFKELAEKIPSSLQKCQEEINSSSIRIKDLRDNFNKIKCQSTKDTNAYLSSVGKEIDNMNTAFKEIVSQLEIVANLKLRTCIDLKTILGQEYSNFENSLNFLENLSSIIFETTEKYYISCSKDVDKNFHLPINDDKIDENKKVTRPDEEIREPDLGQIYYPKSNQLKRSIDFLKRELEKPIIEQSRSALILLKKLVETNFLECKCLFELHKNDEKLLKDTIENSIKKEKEYEKLILEITNLKQQKKGFFNFLWNILSRKDTKNFEKQIQNKEQESKKMHTTLNSKDRIKTLAKNIEFLPKVMEDFLNMEELYKKLIDQYNTREEFSSFTLNYHNLLMESNVSVSSDVDLENHEKCIEMYLRKIKSLSSISQKSLKLTKILSSKPEPYYSLVN